jgi:hypothetical protein
MATGTMASEGASRESRVEDRCVAVVGIDRGGTSATAGLLVGLGLTGPPPEDLVPASGSGDSAHRESSATGTCNGRLLHALGATAMGLPAVTLRWDGVRGFPEIREAALDWFSSAYAGRPMVMKDSRLCMTLPFWRDVLPAPMAAVLVLRDPLSLARSIEAGGEIPKTLGLAVWDRSMRSAALVLEGLATLVLDYDDMTADPAGTTDSVVRFLEQLEVDVAPGLREPAARHFGSALHRQEPQDDEYRDLALVQQQMFDTLLDQRGFHDAWSPPASFPPAPLWVEDALQMRRDLSIKTRQLRNMKSALPNRIGARLGRLTRRSDAHPSPA